MAVYHIREEGRHLFGLRATHCNSMINEYSNGTGCLQIRRVGGAPKLRHSSFTAGGPSTPFWSKQG